MLEFLNFLTSSTYVVIFMVTLLVVYILNSWWNHPSDLPPTPRLPVPFFGHIFYIRPALRDTLERWRKGAGDIFSFYLGSNLVVVIANYELLQETFVKQGDKFSGRPPSFIQQGWKEYTHGVGTNSGKSWKEQRTAAMSILRQLGMGRNSLAEMISGEVEEYLKLLDDLKGAPTNLQMMTSTSISNIICGILVGERFKHNDPFHVKFVQMNNDQFRLYAKASTAKSFPWVQFLPGDFFNAKAIIKNLQNLHTFFSEKFIAQFRHNADDTTRDNFVKAYLREMRNPKNSDFNETHLSRIIDDLFMGGTDTTSITLMWAFAFCLHYPECQKKVYSEIVEKVGTERMPTIENKPDLKYLNAFVMETQRLASILPIGSSHHCSQTTEVGGYKIPKGTTILSYLDAILKDERVWKDAQTFRPERFLDKSGNVFVPKEFIPFSLGRRMCLGEGLAKMELFLFTSAIFQRFEILPEDPDNLPPLISGVSIASHLPPFKVIMKPRPRL